MEILTRIVLGLFALALIYYRIFKEIKGESSTPKFNRNLSGVILTPPRRKPDDNTSENRRQPEPDKKS